VGSRRGEGNREKVQGGSRVGSRKGKSEKKGKSKMAPKGNETAGCVGPKVFSGGGGTRGKGLCLFLTNKIHRKGLKGRGDFFAEKTSIKKGLEGSSGETENLGER